MTVPKEFRNVGERGILNYDWKDISGGIGTVVFYGQYTRDADGVVYKMTKNITPSRYEGVSGGNFTIGRESFSSATGTTNISHKFESDQFNAKAIMLGTLEVVACVATDSVGGVITGYFFTITVYKFSGGVETQIATITTSQAQTANAGDSLGDIATIPLDIPFTPMGIGDTLRIEVTAEFRRVSGGGTVKHYLGHDPTNLDGTGITPSTSNNNQTRMEFHVPFKVDL